MQLFMKMEKFTNLCFELRFDLKSYMPPLLLSKAKAFENYFTNQNDSNFTVRDLSKHILKIEVSWDANGSSFSRNIRDFYFNQNDINNKPEAKIFLFTGSRMIEKTFMAEHTGSILGVYMDPDAIINSIESNSDNDELWLAKKSTMPPLSRWLPAICFCQNKID